MAHLSDACLRVMRVLAGVVPLAVRPDGAGEGLQPCDGRDDAGRSVDPLVRRQIDAVRCTSQLKSRVITFDPSWQSRPELPHPYD